MRATRRRRLRRRLHDSDGAVGTGGPHDSGALVARKTGSYSGRGRLVVAGDADGALLRLPSPVHWFFAERSYDLNAIGGRRALGVWRKQHRDVLRSLVGAAPRDAFPCERIEGPSPRPEARERPVARFRRTAQPSDAPDPHRARRPRPEPRPSLSPALDQIHRPADCNTHIDLCVFVIFRAFLCPVASIQHWSPRARRAWRRPPRIQLRAGIPTA